MSEFHDNYQGLQPIREDRLDEEGVDPNSAHAAPLNVDRLGERPDPVEAPVFDVTVSFLILPENYVLKEVFLSNMPIFEVRQRLASKLRIAPDSIHLSINRRPLLDGDQLDHHNPNLDAEMQVEMAINYVPPTVEPPPYRLPDRIHVHVTDEDGSNAHVVEVWIERMADEMKKPYLGGFRHKLTGIVYHHASSQTISVKKPPPSVIKFERQSQTYETTTRSQQTNREASTQMPKPGLFIDDSRDRFIEIRSYTNSDTLLQLKIQLVIKIQCAVRSFLARQRVNRLREEKYQQQLEILQKQREEAKMNELNNQRQIQRRMHPRSAQDFEILYRELEAWRLHETDVIKSSPELNEEEKQQRLRELLHKETKLLQTIDRLKIVANKENREERIHKTLASMASPKTWSLNTGETAVVHTPFTTRAQELAQLFNGLRLPSLSMEERLDVLLHVKWTVKEFDCNLTREIVDLIDREIDLLKRGRSEKSLEGLRKRLCNLFLNFVNTPEFNPESMRFQKVPASSTSKPTSKANASTRSIGSTANVRSTSRASTGV